MFSRGIQEKIVLKRKLALNGLILFYRHTLNFFALLCGASKGFMNAFKAFIKPFEAPQSVKIKIIGAL